MNENDLQTKYIENWECTHRCLAGTMVVVSGLTREILSSLNENVVPFEMIMKTHTAFVFLYVVFLQPSDNLICEEWILL